MSKINKRKRGAAQIHKELNSALEKIENWSTNSSFGYLLIFSDASGMHHVGTDRMKDKFLLTQAQDKEEENNSLSWETAMEVDSSSLKEKTTEEKLKKKTNDEDVKPLTKLYIENETPKLPCPIEHMSVKDCRKYLIQELKKCFVEQGLPPVTFVPWGQVKYQPLFWPEALHPWEKISNLAHTQKHKMDVDLIHLMKAAITERLRLKGLDVNFHIKDIDSNLENKTTRAKKPKYSQSCENNTKDNSNSLNSDKAKRKETDCSDLTENSAKYIQITSKSMFPVDKGTKKGIGKGKGGRHMKVVRNQIKKVK